MLFNERNGVINFIDAKRKATEELKEQKGTGLHLNKCLEDCQ